MVKIRGLNTVDPVDWILSTAFRFKDRHPHLAWLTAPIWLPSIGLALFWLVYPPTVWLTWILGVMVGGPALWILGVVWPSKRHLLHDLIRKLNELADITRLRGPSCGE